MIDGFVFKIDDPDCVSKILTNSSLKWLTNGFDQDTGEYYNQTANFPALDHFPKENEVVLRFAITQKNSLYIRGSLHRYYNYISIGENHNYNDFSINDIFAACIDLCQRFSINPFHCKVNPFEFGVNIFTDPIKVDEILRSIINHSGTQFNQEFSKEKYFRECTHVQYTVKAYDKGKQNNLDDELFRFEIKVKKMEYLNNRFKKEGITRLFYLPDLLNQDIFSTLGTILTENWKDLLIYDYSIKLDQLNEKNRLFLIQCQNPQIWDIWRDENKNTVKKRKNRFIKLIKLFGKQDLQGFIGKLISDKWNELNQVNEKTLSNLTTFLESNFKKNGSEQKANGIDIYTKINIIPFDLYSTMSKQITTTEKKVVNTKGKLYSCRGTAKIIGCDESSIRYGIKKGEIPPSAINEIKRANDVMIDFSIADKHFGKKYVKKKRERTKRKFNTIYPGVQYHRDLKKSKGTISDYSKYCGCSPSYVYRAIRLGVIPGDAIIQTQQERIKKYMINIDLVPESFIMGLIENKTTRRLKGKVKQRVTAKYNISNR